MQQYPAVRFMVAHGRRLAVPVGLALPATMPAGIACTIGHVPSDPEGRARHRAGDVVPGLYAAGSASGGMEGGPTAAYLGGLAKAVITGLRAAESIANAKQASHEGVRA